MSILLWVYSIYNSDFKACGMSWCTSLSEFFCLNFLSKTPLQCQHVGWTEHYYSVLSSPRLSHFRSPFCEGTSLYRTHRSMINASIILHTTVHLVSIPFLAAFHPISFFLFFWSAVHMITFKHPQNEKVQDWLVKVVKGLNEPDLSSLMHSVRVSRKNASANLSRQAK